MLYEVITTLPKLFESFPIIVGRMKKFISLLVATLTLIGFQMIATADADVTSGVLSIKDVDTAPVPVKQEGPIVGDDIKGIAAMVHIRNNFV